MKAKEQVIPSIRFWQRTLTSELFEVSSTESKAFVHRRVLTRPWFYYVTWIETGSGYYTLDFKDYEVRPQTIYFLLPGQVHAWRLNDDFKGLSLIFKPEYLVMGQSQGGLGQLELLQYQRERPFVSVPETQIENFRNLLQEMRAEYLADHLGRNIVLQAQLQQFLVKAERLYTTQRRPGAVHDRAAAALARSFLTLLSNKILELRTVADFAVALEVSPVYLSEVVRDTTGQPPSVHLRQRLVLEAKRLLAHTDNTVQAIGYHLGFDDPAYFSRFFKREAGVTPKQFRSEILREYQNI